MEHDSVVDAAAASVLTDYKPVRAKKSASSRNPLASESKFWNSFLKKDTPQHVSGVRCINFCPEYPHDFAVTSSTRVSIYNGETCELKRTIGRFADVAYSGAFRSDGQLLVAGGENGMIQVFDTNSRLVLRELKGHTRAVHWVRYSPQDKLHVLSAGDDNTVRWWDVTTQVEVLIMKEHNDYVRCGASNPSSADLWATGSYDDTVRLWDLRTSESILQLQHGKPLEDVLFFPSGGLLATTGGNFVKIWDILGGGKLLHVLSSHQKTVTSVSFTPPVKSNTNLAEASPRLLTGSLDGHVKVFDMFKFKVTHAVKYPAPILSLDVSQSGMTMAIGTSTGLLFIRQRKGVGPYESAKEKSEIDGQPPKQASCTTERILHPNNYRYFLRGQYEKASEGDYYVTHQRKPRLAEHDRFFRKFQYKEALVASLKTSDPTVVVAVIEELVARRGLNAAILNLDNSNLEVLLAFVQKYVTLPKYSKLLIQFAHMLLNKRARDLAISPTIQHLVEVLREKVAMEVHLQESLQCLQGLIQPLIQASFR